MNGLDPNRVHLEAYDESWPEKFAAESATLRRTLGPLAGRIEHFGSTSVPGLDAKPILDIAVQTSAVENLPRVGTLLAAEGYIAKGEFGLPGRHFFVRGNPVNLHLHVVAEGCEHWTRWLAFRDALRADARLRQDYLKLKRELAARYVDNRPAYTAAKTEFITRICDIQIKRA